MTPIFNISFRVSDAMMQSWPSYEYNALMPDIIIHQTFEDFINNRDTVLDAVRAGGLRDRLNDVD